MKKRVDFVLFGIVSLVFLLLILTTGVIASFDLDKKEIRTNYSAGDTISGEINISFSNEPAKAMLTSNFDGNISLLEFLEINGYDSGDDFNCSTAGCGVGYVKKNAINSVTLNGQNKFVGFSINGNDITSIESVVLGLNSNIGSSCFVQAEIDFLGDGEKKIVNSKYNDVSCSPVNYGCFDRTLSSGDYEEAIIGTQEYCEKISLPPSPGYRAGAKIKNSTNGQVGEIEMRFYDLEGVFLEKCTLPGLTQSNQNRDCILNHSSYKQEEFLVCVAKKTGNTADYSVKSESVGEKCGSDDLGDTFNLDYEIYARSLQFADLDFQINDEMFLDLYQEELTDYVYDYVLDEFDGYCPNDCIIPIKFIGGNQEIVFDSVEIQYKKGGTTSRSNSIYDIDEEEAEITSGILSLDLEEAGFVIPLGSKEDEFKIYLDGDLIFKKDIKIKESFSFDVKPRFVLIGANTLFSAITSENITSSEWNFGTGDVANSNNKNVTYRYTDAGDFDISVKLRNSKGIDSTRTFKITVGNARESANSTIKVYNERIGNLTAQIDAMPSWIKDEIKEKVDPGLLGASLLQIEKKFDLSINDEDYVEVVNDLLDLNVPYSVSISEKGESPLIVGAGEINGDYLEEISLGQGEDNLEERIASWMQENYNSVADFEVYSAFYDESVENLVTSFKLNFEKIGESGDGEYFFIDYPIDSVNFKQSYGEKQVGGGSGAYIPISNTAPGTKTTFELSLPEKISVQNLGIYISPDASKLPVLESGGIREAIGDRIEFSYSKFIIGIIVLIIVFLIVYVILQEWYKRNYETSLFKTKDRLYNVLSFIYNSRVAGLKDSEIRSKLKSSGWNGEQISYALNKIDGRRTGMWEIPIFKFAENNKVKKEIQNRQPVGRKVDVRFIKRPRL